MTDPVIVALVDEGLGNSSYLVDLGDGRCLVLDPTRDLRTVRLAADRAGLRIGYVAETHLHADFVSGACQLSAIDGAQILAGDGAREFGLTTLADQDECDLGGLTLRALATPGHSFDHLSYLLLDGTRPVAAFTGGSLLVGAVARTDLAGTDHSDELARAQFRSLRRIAALPTDLAVYPTHGAGSFCSADTGAERTTTIGRELATNPLLAITDEDEFVRTLLEGFGSYPTYFRRLAEINRRGPAVIHHRPVMAELAPATVAGLQRAGAEVIDVRPPRRFAAAHLPGSLSIALRPAFATWLGWIVDPTRRLVFVRDREQDPEEIIWQCLKVGYDNLAGELAGGVGAWQSAALPVTANDIALPAALDGWNVLDVRQDSEFSAGHAHGALHRELGAVADSVVDLPSGPLAVMCGHGERAATAASILERAGRGGAAIVLAGQADSVRATHPPRDATR